MSTRDEMIKALRVFKDANGQPALRTLLESVAEVSAISEVPDDKIADVIAACENAPAGDKPKSLDELTTRAFAKWNAAKKSAS
jgi:hypothetical protein